ncbi:DUF1801 domain-containing protein [Micrococcaceae bacterium RIT802]|nr:DUF1801 domain-containing protein [Micrococcaceae bacterium RIT 802]
MATKPETVDQYIDSFPTDARRRLVELRELVRSHAPAATEELKWGNPAYSLDVILLVFSGHRDHANLVFTPSTLQAHLGELDGYGTGKGSVRLPYDQPIPADLLGRMIAYRIRELHDDGVKWR